MAKIVGTGANDTLLGTDESDRIWSLGGNDIVDGGDGDDILDGGAGNDTLNTSSGFDELTGGEGDDRLVFNGVGGAARGGVGIDTLAIDLSGKSDAFLFNSISGHASFGDLGVESNHLYFVDIEKLELTTGSGDDKIIATNLDQINVHSGAGNDHVEGGNGNDIVFGDNGRDALYGGGGNDELHGGASNDYLDGGNGDDSLWGDDGFDSLIGGRGSDIIEAGTGNDYANGGDGNDQLNGGDGIDQLRGGLGDDTLVGGAGGDILTGGDGADTFLWTSSDAGSIDHIVDFGVDDGDVIHFQNFTSGSDIHDFNSFIAASHDTAGGVFVSFGDDSTGILIENVSLSDLTPDDVVFS